MVLALGEVAPAFSLPNAQGEQVALADAKGCWQVLYFYPKALTPGCTTQACALRDGFANLKAKGVQVWGVSADAPAKLAKFAEKEALNFPLLGDESKEMLEAYGAWQEKSMYGRTYMGVQRMTYVIDPEGKVAEVWPKVSPKEHLQVLEKWFAEHL